jgi:MFS family permease
MTISIILLFVFFLKLYQNKQALFDIKLFKINTFRVTILGSFISRIGVGGIPFILALMLQVDFKYSALDSGLLTLPYAIGMIFTKLCINKLIKIFGYRGILFTNTILLGISIMSFAFLSKDSNLVIIGSLFFICGLLTSAQYSCLNILSYIDVPHKEVSSATSIGTTVQQIAMSFGVAFCAILLTVFSYNGGLSYEYSFLALGIYTMLSSFIFLKL